MQKSTAWWQKPNLIKTLRAEFGDEVTKKYLRTKFQRVENKMAFAVICFPHHLISKSPEFHEELLGLLSHPGNVGVAAPRGFAKSTMMMIDDAFDIVNAYRHYIVRLSDSFTQALEHLNTLQYELEYNPMLLWLYGNLKTKDWASGEFVTSTDVKIVAKGQGMKVRGLKYKQWRPDKVGIDDLENDELVANSERRNKLYNWFKMGVLPALAKNGKINYVGTILHTDALLARITSGEGEFVGWKTKIFSAIKDDGTSLWPDLWPVTDLLSLRDDPKNPRYLGSHVFAQEMQNKPVNEVDAIIKRAWIKYQDLIPETKIRIIVVDPAISKKETADFSSIQCWGLGLDENCYCIEKQKARLGFKELGYEIRAMFQRHKCDMVIIETVAYQEALKENDSLKDLPILEYHPARDKRTRLIVVSKWFQAGQVYFKSDMDSAVDEVVGFGSSPHDDECDTVTMGIYHLKSESDKLKRSDIFFG